MNIFTRAYDWISGKDLLMPGGRAKQVTDEPEKNTVESMVREGRTLVALTGDELWDLYSCTNITASMFQTIQHEVNHRLTKTD